MILGFGILSKAVSSPEILRFKVAIKCGTFALDFVPSYDQSGEREPWPRNYQTLTNTPSSLRSLGVIIKIKVSQLSVVRGVSDFVVDGSVSGGEGSGKVKWLI